MIAGGGGTRKVVFSRDAILLIMRSHEVTSTAWTCPGPPFTELVLVWLVRGSEEGFSPRTQE
jgi:hypothetical protein